MEKAKLNFKDTKEILIAIEAKKRRTGDWYFLLNMLVTTKGGTIYQNRKEFKNDTSRKVAGEAFSYFFGEKYGKMFFESSFWASELLRDFAEKYKMKISALELSNKPYAFYHLYK